MKRHMLIAVLCLTTTAAHAIDLADGSGDIARNNRTGGTRTSAVEDARALLARVKDRKIRVQLGEVVENLEKGAYKKAVATLKVVHDEAIVIESQSNEISFKAALSALISKIKGSDTVIVGPFD